MTARPPAVPAQAVTDIVTDTMSQKEVRSSPHTNFYDFWVDRLARRPDAYVAPSTADQLLGGHGKSRYPRAAVTRLYARAIRRTEHWRSRCSKYSRSLHPPATAPAMPCCRQATPRRWPPAERSGRSGIRAPSPPPNRRGLIPPAVHVVEGRCSLGSLS